MRFLLPFAAALLAVPATAQSNMLQGIQPGHSAATSDNVQQVKMVDDNDPFTPNQFEGSFRMEMHSYTNGVEQQDSPVHMRYWSSPGMSLIGISPEGGKGSELKVLTDHEGKWNYMLMADEKGNKTAMKSRKKKLVIEGQEESGAEAASKFTVTNETRMIEGHLCTKVIADTEDGTWTGWVAPGIAVPFGDIANRMSRSAIQRKQQDWQGLQGFPLEYELVDKNGKDRMVVQVKDLQIGTVDPAIFSIADYKVMEIPGIAR